MNGWILDGFPQTVEQINAMKELKIKPSLVCVFEQPEEVSIERVSNRRIDVESGKVISINQVKTDDLEALSKYVQMKEDTEAVVKKRYNLWNDHVQKIEEAYKKVLLNIQTDIKADLITDLIADAI